MQKLTCEMCGSTDLVKDGGVFVCQVCGCKYSVAEAKKMMIEGTVQVAGTVRIDVTDQAQNFREILHTAYEAKNYTEALHYANKVLEMNTHDPEAWYYKGLICCTEKEPTGATLHEILVCWKNAWTYTPEADRPAIQERLLHEFQGGALFKQLKFIEASFLLLPDLIHFSTFHEGLTTFTDALTKPTSDFYPFLQSFQGKEMEDFLNLLFAQLSVEMAKLMTTNFLSSVQKYGQTIFRLILSCPFTNRELRGNDEWICLRSELGLLTIDGNELFDHLAQAKAGITILRDSVNLFTYTPEIKKRLADITELCPEIGTGLDKADQRLQSRLAADDAIGKKIQAAEQAIEENDQKAAAVRDAIAEINTRYEALKNQSFVLFRDSKLSDLLEEKNAACNILDSLCQENKRHILERLQLIFQLMEAPTAS